MCEGLGRSNDGSTAHGEVSQGISSSLQGIQKALGKTESG